MAWAAISYLYLGLFLRPSNCGMSVQFHALFVVYRPLMGTIRGFFEGHETNRGTYSRVAESRGAQCRLVCPQVVVQSSQCVQDIPQRVYRYRATHPHLSDLELRFFSIFFGSLERGVTGILITLLTTKRIQVCR